MSLRSDFKINALTPSDPTRNAKKTGVPSINHESIVATGMGPRRRRVAFLVTHGMGQQVPFETLSMLGQALITEHGKQAHVTAPEPSLQVDLRRVRLTTQTDAPELSRVEVCLIGKNGDLSDVHVYESYWAPFTEGQISFTATVAFLYQAAWNGIWTALKSRSRAKESSKEGMTREQREISAKNETDSHLKHFDRWMFGKFRDMAITRSTFRLLVAMVVGLTLLLLPALMIFTPAGIAAGKYIVDWFQPIYAHWLWTFRVLSIVLIVAFFIVAVAVRWLVVEFVGDVAIYVSSYKVSRYNDIRARILNQVMSVAREIYSAGIVDKLQDPYDDIVIVGHSLGSVISYDLLNWCINWDQVENDFKFKVVERTRRLITFGSPLDKTAFLFRTQVSDARNLREALAARQQPLILDYVKFRPLKTFRWINIHSPADIVSGFLDYYDVEFDDDGTPIPGFNKVDNRIDRDATTPLLAHVQYWNNAELHQQLYDGAWAGANIAP